MDETIRPPMVQPFERGSRTVGFAVYTGERGFERLDVSQMARLKNARVQWVPQYGVVEKAVRLAIAEDDIDSLPIMPSMVGGSLLYAPKGLTTISRRPCWAWSGSGGWIRLTSR
jgi:hypothetical protein